MSPTFKEYVFDFSDLNLISVVCGYCSCEMIVDVNHAQTKLPESCSACGHPLGELLNGALYSFHKAYQDIKKKTVENGPKVRIRIRRPVNLPEG